MSKFIVRKIVDSLTYYELEDYVEGSTPVEALNNAKEDYGVWEEIPKLNTHMNIDYEVIDEEGNIVYNTFTEKVIE